MSYRLQWMSRCERAMFPIGSLSWSQVATLLEEVIGLVGCGNSLEEVCSWGGLWELVAWTHFIALSVSFVLLKCDLQTLCGWRESKDTLCLSKTLYQTYHRAQSYTSNSVCYTLTAKVFTSPLSSKLRWHWSHLGPHIPALYIPATCLCSSSTQANPQLPPPRTFYFLFLLLGKLPPSVSLVCSLATPTLTWSSVC